MTASQARNVPCKRRIQHHQAAEKFVSQLIAGMMWYVEAVGAKNFRIRECQKAMDRAARKVGMARITHQDLRHFFATVCIESGVEIPTVSRWLGHKDGGALAMRTYGHLRREHSVAQALKVSFAPGPAALVA